MKKVAVVCNISKLNWKLELLGVKVPRRVLNCENCRADETRQACVSDPK